MTCMSNKFMNSFGFAVFHFQETGFSVGLAKWQAEGN